MRQFIPLRFGAYHVAHNVLEMRRGKTMEFFQDRWCTMLDRFIGAANHFHIDIAYTSAL